MTSEIAGFVLQRLVLTCNCLSHYNKAERESALLGNNKYKPFKAFTSHWWCSSIFLVSDFVILVRFFFYTEQICNDKSFGCWIRAPRRLLCWKVLPTYEYSSFLALHTLPYWHWLLGGRTTHRFWHVDLFTARWHWWIGSGNNRGTMGWSETNTR